MKTAGVLVECVSIWCPECNSFYENPEDGSSLISEFVLVEKMGSTLECRDCGAKFRKPQVTFERGRKPYAPPK